MFRITYPDEAEKWLSQNDPSYLQSRNRLWLTARQLQIRDAKEIPVSNLTKKQQRQAAKLEPYFYAAE